MELKIRKMELKMKVKNQMHHQLQQFIKEQHTKITQLQRHNLETTTMKKIDEIREEYELKNGQLTSILLG